ncbi:hypothetical protein EON66_09665 [archaeon]|nr:MAG: hypothetical protein EON66_09665 [archaeon]
MACAHIARSVQIRDVYGGMVGSGGKFYDIGSGTGKAVFFAALVHAWDTCVGIELLSGLHEASLEMLSRWHSDEIRPKLPPHAVECPIHFLQDDITAYDWSDGDVVFANSTCFDEALMLSLATTADRMRLGSFMVTFTKRLPSFKWKVRAATALLHTRACRVSTCELHPCAVPSRACRCWSQAWRACRGGRPPCSSSKR